MLFSRTGKPILQKLLTSRVDTNCSHLGFHWATRAPVEFAESGAPAENRYWAAGGNGRESAPPVGRDPEKAGEAPPSTRRGARATLAAW
jgi:hypothetical protein